MILGLVQLKGGTGKSTLALCLSHSKAFRRAFRSICLVELDEQETLARWYAKREHDDVAFLHLRPDNAEAGLRDALKRHDCLVVDSPGESVGRFSSRLVCALADYILIPMRTSAFDESAFAHLWEVLQAVETPRAVVPTSTSTRADGGRLRQSWLDILPPGVDCLSAPLPARAVFAEFPRNGRTLQEFERASAHNVRLLEQTRKAGQDIEAIAKETLHNAQET